MNTFSFDNMPGSRYENELRRVLQIIEDAAAADWTLSESGAFEKAVSVPLLSQSKGVHMSPTGLKNHFKQAIGISIGKYAKKRRAAYMGRLFATRPDMMAKDVANRVGFANPPALYPFIKSIGVNDPQTLRDTAQPSRLIEPSYTATLPEFKVLAISHFGNYTDFNDSQFEDEWDMLEHIAIGSDCEVKSYLGIAIDDFIHKKPETGLFTVAVEIASPPGANQSLLDKRYSIITIPSSDYVVFTHIGDYEGLIEFYQNALSVIKNSTKYTFSPDGVMFEKYFNSQKESNSCSLVTELWIPTAPV